MAGVKGQINHVNVQHVLGDLSCTAEDTKVIVKYGSRYYRSSPVKQKRALKCSAKGVKVLWLRSGSSAKSSTKAPTEEAWSGAKTRDILGEITNTYDITITHLYPDSAQSH